MPKPATDLTDGEAWHSVRQQVRATITEGAYPTSDWMWKEAMRKSNIYFTNDPMAAHFILNMEAAKIQEIIFENAATLKIRGMLDPIKIRPMVESLGAGKIQSHADRRNPKKSPAASQCRSALDPQRWGPQAARGNKNSDASTLQMDEIGGNNPNLDLVPGKTRCWLCGAPISTTTEDCNKIEKTATPQEKKNLKKNPKALDHHRWNVCERNTPQCEHIVPCLRAAMTVGMFSIAEVMENIKKKSDFDPNQWQAWNASTADNYLWSHAICNRAKSDDLLIKIDLNKNPMEFEFDRDKGTILAQKITEIINRHQIQPWPQECPSQETNPNAGCFTVSGQASRYGSWRTRQEVGAGIPLVAYEWEYNRICLAINEVWGKFDGNLPAFAEYCLAQMKLYLQQKESEYLRSDLNRSMTPWGVDEKTGAMAHANNFTGELVVDGHAYRGAEAEARWLAAAHSELHFGGRGRRAAAPGGAASAAGKVMAGGKMPSFTDITAEQKEVLENSMLELIVNMSAQIDTVEKIHKSAITYQEQASNANDFQYFIFGEHGRGGADKYLCELRIRQQIYKIFTVYCRNSVAVLQYAVMCEPIINFFYPVRLGSEDTAGVNRFYEPGTTPQTAANINEFNPAFGAQGLMYSLYALAGEQQEGDNLAEPVLIEFISGLVINYIAKNGAPAYDSGDGAEAAAVAAAAATMGWFALANPPHPTDETATRDGVLEVPLPGFRDEAECNKFLIQQFAALIGSVINSRKRKDTSLNPIDLLQQQGEKGVDPVAAVNAIIQYLLTPGTDETITTYMNLTPHTNELLVADDAGRLHLSNVIGCTLFMKLDARHHHLRDVTGVAVHPVLNSFITNGKNHFCSSVINRDIEIQLTSGTKWNKSLPGGVSPFVDNSDTDDIRDDWVVKGAKAQMAAAAASMAARALAAHAAQPNLTQAQIDALNAPAITALLPGRRVERPVEGGTIRRKTKKSRKKRYKCSNRKVNSKKRGKKKTRGKKQIRRVKRRKVTKRVKRRKIKHSRKTR
jgi:hypothetical protein